MTQSETALRDHIVLVGKSLYDRGYEGIEVHGFAGTVSTPSDSDTKESRGVRHIKFAESLGEGKKLKTDDGSVSWSKGRSKLDNEAWEAAKSEKPELADIEKSAEEWKNKLKKAQSKFMAAGAPSLVIRTP